MKVANKLNYYYKFLKLKAVNLTSLAKDHSRFLLTRKTLLQETKVKVLSILNADFLSFCVFSNFIFFQKKHEKVILFTSFFNSVPERNKEHFFSINKNLNNNYINEVIIFTDKNSSIILPKSIRSHQKLKIIHNKSKITFLDFFSYFKRSYSSKDIFVVANCDCYFDKSVKILLYLDFSGKKIFCCTRKEFNKKGILSYSESIDSYNLYNKEKNNLDLSSSDCFILPFDFKEDEILSNSYIGDINIEFNFLSQCFIKKYIIQNLFCFLNCIHHHKSQFRTNHRNTFNNFINLIYPNKSLNPVSEKNYIFGTWRLRNKYNYIDKNSEVQDFGDYLPLNSSELMSLKKNIHTDLINQQTLCLFYILTEQEIKSNTFLHSVSSFFNLLPSLKHKVKIFCFINTSSINAGSLKLKILNSIKYESHVIDIEFQYLDIDVTDDIYIRDFNEYKNLEKKPTLGQSSGPNLMFYKSIAFLKNTEYKNFLLLESDCTCLKSYWLDNFLNFIDSNNFTISGGKYIGLNKHNYKQYYSEHINGSAIYSNSALLHQYISESISLIKNSLNKSEIQCLNEKYKLKEAMFSFDVALFLVHKINRNLESYLENDFFSILTDPVDSIITKTEALNNNKNCIILHQKPIN